MKENQHKLRAPQAVPRMALGSIKVIASLRKLERARQRPAKIMDLAHRKRRRDDEPGVAPPGRIITIEEWAHQYGWHPCEREESVARARV